MFVTSEQLLVLGLTVSFHASNQDKQPGPEGVIHNENLLSGSWSPRWWLSGADPQLFQVTNLLRSLVFQNGFSSEINNPILRIDRAFSGSLTGEAPAALSAPLCWEGVSSRLWQSPLPS